MRRPMWSRILRITDAWVMQPTTCILHVQAEALKRAAGVLDRIGVEGKAGKDIPSQTMTV